MKSKLKFDNLENIIFDFDGVILDSVECKTEAFYQMYLPYGEKIANNVKKHHILNGGMSRFDKFKLWHKKFLKIDLKEEEIQGLSSEFSDLVFEKVISSRPVFGSLEFINKFYKDFNFFIISGTPNIEIKKICTKIGINDKFLEILGSPKNKIDWCNELKHKYKIKNSNTLFIGVAISDYNAAKKSKFYFALRNSDYNKSIFSKIDVDFKIDDFEQLKNNLEFPKLKILVTTTSFQDSPGEHHDLLKDQDWDIDYLRGPLKEYDLLSIIQDYDGVLCGDDEYSRRVIKKGSSGRLKVLSKYGVGLDKIDLDASNEFGVKVTNCPGINFVSVAEHVLALLLSFEKNITTQNNSVQKGSWKRLIGREIKYKTIGIIGHGAIGKEISLLLSKIGMKVLVFDIKYDKEFFNKNNEIKFEELDTIFMRSDYISLHTPLNESTKNIINKNSLSKMKKDVVIINTARGELVNKKDLINAINNDQIRGYLCDVLDVEPIESGEELLDIPNVIITPHVASRTNENIINQGKESINNLIKSLKK